jgi:prophage regulatory protein
MTEPTFESELIRAAEAAHLCGVAKRTWWRLVSSGRAPAPIRLGGSVRWRRAELSDWIAGGCKPVRTIRKGGDV